MLLWALWLNRRVENFTATEFAAKEPMQKWLLRKICKRKTQNYSTFQNKEKILEIYCCSSPYLAILFSVLPLRLTAFSVEWMKASLFQFSPVSQLIYTSCKNMSLWGLIPEKSICTGVCFITHTFKIFLW